MRGVDLIENRLALGMTDGEILADLAEEVEQQVNTIAAYHESCRRFIAENTRLRGALEPFAKVFDAFLDNGLDEARPEWDARHGADDPEKVELLGGRGGKELLTLADMKRARDALIDDPPAESTP